MMFGLREMGDAVIDVLEGAGLAVGDAVAPSGVGWQGTPGQSDFIPYVIVYPTGGGALQGSLGAPRSDLSVIYQFTCVGATRSQADWVRDKVREHIFDASAYALGTYTILDITIEVPIATSRDDDVQPPVFFSADRVRVRAVPVSQP